MVGYAADVLHDASTADAIGESVKAAFLAPKIVAKACFCSKETSIYARTAVKQAATAETDTASGFGRASVAVTKPTSLERPTFRLPVTEAQEMAEAREGPKAAACCYLSPAATPAKGKMPQPKAKRAALFPTRASPATPATDMATAVRKAACEAATCAAISPLPSAERVSSSTPTSFAKRTATRQRCLCASPVGPANYAQAANRTAPSPRIHVTTKPQPASKRSTAIG